MLAGRAKPPRWLLELSESTRCTDAAKMNQSVKLATLVATLPKDDRELSSLELTLLERISTTVEPGSQLEAVHEVSHR